MIIVPRGGVLALDLSTEVGWAYGTREMGAPIWGVWKLPAGHDMGRLLASYENELLDAFDRYAPGDVSMEAPLPAGQHKGHLAAEILIKLAGATESACYRWEKPLRSRASSTVRSQVCGRAHRSDEEVRAGLHIKDAVVRPWIEAQGWKVTNHNARDACVVWAYEIGHRHPSKLGGKLAA